MTIYIRPDGTICDKESGIEFEDQEKIANLLHKPFTYYLKPDMIIENVDVETEKVWQEWNEGKWVNSLWPHWDERKQYRTVLRIKDKQ